MTDRAFPDWLWDCIAAQNPYPIVTALRVSPELYRELEARFQANDEMGIRASMSGCAFQGFQLKRDPLLVARKIVREWSDGHRDLCEFGTPTSQPGIALTLGDGSL